MLRPSRRAKTVASSEAGGGTGAAGGATFGAAGKREGAGCGSATGTGAGDGCRCSSAEAGHCFAPVRSVCIDANSLAILGLRQYARIKFDLRHPAKMIRADIL